MQGRINENKSKKQLLVMEKLSSHPLLQNRTNFVSSMNEFAIFLKVTLDDLNVKSETLKAQKKILRENRKAKNYLSCQIYMLKKYIKRVERFSVEIETRLEEALNKNSSEDNSQNQAEKWDDRVTSTTESNVDKDTSIENTFKESAIDCDELEGNKSNYSNSLQRRKFDESGDSLQISTSSGSCFNGSITQYGSVTLDSITSLSEDTISNSHNDETNIDSITSDKECNIANNNNDGTKFTKKVSNNNESNNSLDDVLTALTGDMKKMKRRCKHLLDVTDKYCVLNNETDLKLDVQQDEVIELTSSLSKSPITSPWSMRSSRSCSPISGLASPTSADGLSTSEDEVDGSKISGLNEAALKLPSSINDQGLVKMTLGSVSVHLGVLIKTYTRRHSS